MKQALPLLTILFIAMASCNEPMKVTARPDPHTATSGTLGSAKFTEQLPKADSSRMPVDSFKVKRDTLP